MLLGTFLYEKLIYVYEILPRNFEQQFERSIGLYVVNKYVQVSLPVPRCEPRPSYNIDLKNDNHSAIPLCNSFYVQVYTHQSLLVIGVS